LKFRRPNQCQRGRNFDKMFRPTYFASIHRRIFRYALGYQRGERMSRSISVCRRVSVPIDFFQPNYASLARARIAAKLPTWLLNAGFKRIADFPSSAANPSHALKDRSRIGMPGPRHGCARMFIGQLRTSPSNDLNDALVAKNV